MATVRLCVLGEVSSGKTTLVKTYQEITEGQPCNKHLTLGAPNFFHFTPKVTDKSTNLSVWDLPGEKRMRQLNTTYFHKVDAFILTLDLTDANSMSRLEEHLALLLKTSHFISKPVVLACTKAEAAVKYISEDSVVEFLKKHTFICKYFYVSSLKPHTGINDLFEYATRITQESLLEHKDEKKMLLKLSK